MSAPAVHPWQDVPESFWNVATWHADENWSGGSLDVADRKRIAEFFMAVGARAALLEAADECDVRQMGAKVDCHDAEKGSHDEFFKHGKKRAWGEARILLRAQAMRVVRSLR